MDVTQRFSKNVNDYILYRPGYPSAIIQLMEEKMGLEEYAVIGDIGSGTGKLAELFLEHEHLVYGVEPNRAMREAAEQLLEEHENFSSVAGTAEETTLEDKSVDFIVAGQAFHWFKLKKFRKECRRVLPKDGWVLLIWNDRDDSRSAFMELYENFLQEYSTDYSEIDHRKVDEKALQRFFKKSKFTQAIFPNEQIFDLEGLIGRYLSCSYALKETDEQYQKAIDRLSAIFKQEATNGVVTMTYHTRVFYSQIHQEVD